LATTSQLSKSITQAPTPAPTLRPTRAPTRKPTTAPVVITVPQENPNLCIGAGGLCSSSADCCDGQTCSRSWTPSTGVFKSCRSSSSWWGF
jgi:hypothetical protein